MPVFGVFFPHFFFLSLLVMISDWILIVQNRSLRLFRLFSPPPGNFLFLFPICACLVNNIKLETKARLF